MGDSMRRNPDGKKSLTRKPCSLTPCARGIDGTLLVILGIAAICLWPSWLLADDNPPAEAQQAWLIKDYRYVPASDKDNPDTGLALCGTRCNAMTTDYRNVIDPGGYRYIRIAEDRELVIQLDNPFIGGHCVCVADEYVIRINDLTGPER